MLPQNVETEAAVLGSILIDPDAIGDVRGFLRPEHFYLELHRVVYQAMLDLDDAGITIDLLTLQDHLARHGELERLGGGHVITALANQVPSSANVVAYAESVAGVSVNRTLISAAAKIAAIAYANPPAQDALRQSEELLTEIREHYATAHPAPHTGFSLKELLQLELPEPNWIVPGILPEGLTLLAGKPKSGKSWLSLALAIATGAGGRALGQIAIERGEALYLALEDNQRRLKQRALQLLGDDPVPDGVQFETAWRRLDDGGVGDLEDWLIEHPQARLVIVDTLAKVRPEPSGANASVYADDYRAFGDLKRLADTYHVAILVIHHLRKLSAADPFDEISGSTGLTGAVDNVMVMRRERGRPEATLFMAGRDVDEQELALSFEASRGLWVLNGNAEDVRRSRLQQGVLEALASSTGPLSIREVADMMSSKYDQAKNLLWRMEREGVIQRTERGLYQLPPPEPFAQPAQLPNFANFANFGEPGTTTERQNDSSLPPQTSGGRVESWEVGKVGESAQVRPGVRAPNLDIEACPFESHADEFWFFDSAGIPRCKLCHPRASQAATDTPVEGGAEGA